MKRLVITNRLTGEETKGNWFAKSKYNEAEEVLIIEVLNEEDDFYKYELEEN